MDHNRQLNQTVVVITGAAPLHDRALACVPDDTVILAADGALDHALAAGLQPDHLVGDLDSISPSGLEWAREHADIFRADPAKDHTDTELALALAVELDPGRLVFVGGGGDRLDHTFAAIGALGHPSLTSIPVIDGWWGGQRFHVVHGPGHLSLVLPLGTTVSLLSMHGSCSNVQASGVRWPLVDAEIESLVGLGVSNVTTEERVDVSVSIGVLTVFVDDNSNASISDHEESPE